MSTLVENANRIYNAKQSIVSSINSKGVSVPSGTLIENLPTYINNIVELKGETKIITPTTSEQIITPTSPKNGLTQVTVNPVTNSIDANIVAGNIKNGVSILGVTGTYEGSGGGGSSYFIGVGEFSGSTITITDSNSTVVGTETLSSDGYVEFPISDVGTYTVAVTSGGSTVWTNSSVVVSEKGVTLAKGRVLNNMTAAQIHQACQAGIASKMFSLKDWWTYTSSGSIMNNMKFFITEFFKNQNGTESIQFWMANDEYSTTYQINSYKGYSSNGTSWSSYYCAEGGWKYCNLRTKFMPAGSEIYQQVESMIPSTATMADGIKFGELKYSDTNELASIYTYDDTTDTFTVMSSFTAPSNSSAKFMKGYFYNIGTLTEDQFNAGTFYTATTQGSGNSMYYKYTPATSYSSSTTYYGFYEFLQEDGVFYNAFKSLIDAGYLVDMELKQSNKGSQYTTGSTCNDKVSIPSSSELFGFIKPTPLVYGGTTYTNNYYADPVNYSNTKWSGTDYNNVFPGLSNNVWLRSVSSYNTGYFVCLSGIGNLNGNYVNITYRVRPCFRFN